MTIQDIRSAVEAKVDREFKEFPPAALLQSELYIWIKEAYDVIVQTLRDYFKSSQISTVVNQVEYNLPKNIMGGLEAIRSMTYDLTEVLDRGYLEYLQLQHRQDWQTVGGRTLPSVYVYYGTQGKFGILPKPTAVKTLNLFYLASEPQPEALDDEVPSYFIPFKNVIVDWVTSLAKDKEKDNSGAQWKSSATGMLSTWSQLRPRNPNANDQLDMEDPINER